jgi:hypothetical protein
LQKLDTQYPFVVCVAQRNIPKIRQKISGSIEFAYLDAWQQALNNKDHLIEMIADEIS